MIDNIYLRRLYEKIIDAMKNGYGCGTDKFNKDVIDVAYKPFIEKCFEKFNDMSEHDIVKKLNECNNFYYWLVKCSNDIVFDNGAVIVESTDIYGNKTNNYWKYFLSVYDPLNKEVNPFEPIVVTDSWEYVNDVYEKSIIVVAIDIVDGSNGYDYQSYCLKFVVPRIYYYINPHKDYEGFCEAINLIITGKNVGDKDFEIQLFSLEPVRI